MADGGQHVLRRPLLRWHGGKWRIAPWIIAHLPPHKTYVEPFGGAASVLLRKPRAYAEVYNDLDSEVVHLFHVMRSEAAPALIQAIALTPFSREEFELAYELVADPVERARRLVVRSFMGFGSTGANIDMRTGFRSNAYSSNTHPAADFAGLPDALAAIVKRLRGVVIEQRPAMDVIRHYDAPDALFYVDPPYLHGTRSSKVCRGRIAHGYAHEMTDAEHVTMLEQLLQLRGMVLLSGYPSSIYDDRLRGWLRMERHARDTSVQARREVLWMNPAAADVTGGRLPFPEQTAADDEEEAHVG